MQASPVFLDRDATVEKGVRLINEAADHGARVMAFPEVWIPGYPAWVFGAASWGDEKAKRGYAKLLAEAVGVPSVTTDTLSNVAVERGVTVVMGVNEVSGGTLYNSALYLLPNGQVTVHRKLVPTHAERMVWARCEDGQGLRVVESPYGNIGSLLCWEHWMPLARFAMHAQSELIHAALWPWGYEMTHLASRHYAFEGRCFVLVAGTYMPATALPEDFELREEMYTCADPDGGRGVLFTGGSGVIGPDGQWIVGPVIGKETIIYADLDLDHIGREQYALDIAGHYSRPDIFNLTIDTRKRPQVSWIGGATEESNERLSETVSTG